MTSRHLLPLQKLGSNAGPLNLMLLMLFSRSVMSDSLQPLDYSLPGSSVLGIFQARILEWVAISFSRGSSRPRDGICISCVGRQVPYHWATREAPLVWCGLSLSDQKLHEFQRDSLPACFSPISLHPKALILKMKWTGFQGALDPLLDQQCMCVCPYSCLLWVTYTGFQKTVAHPLTVIKWMLIVCVHSLLFSCSVMSDSFVILWTIAHQAPLSMGFSRQEY